MILLGFLGVNGICMRYGLISYETHGFKNGSLHTNLRWLKGSKSYMLGSLLGHILTKRLGRGLISFLIW